jgi:hypothetical protein
MNYINFLCNHQNANGLQEFTALLARVLPLTRSEVRESGNYLGGEYVKAEIGAGTTLTIAMSEEDFEDLPLWIQVAQRDGDAQSIWARIRAVIVEPLLNSGFSVARINNFGKLDCERVDL